MDKNPSEKESLIRVLEIAKTNINSSSNYDSKCLDNASSFVKYYDEIMNEKGYELEK
jgi:hypothetical protein